MKKFNLLLTMLMLMCFSMGSWAADYELVYTLDGSVTTGGNSNYAQDGGGLTQNGIDWSVTGNTTINPWRIGGKNLTDENRLAYSKTAISANIAKIEIEHGNINLTANSMKVEVASDADFGTILETFSYTTVEANKTVTCLRPSGQDWSSAYYRITYNVTAGGSNSYVQLKSVKFYKEKAATTEPSISIEQNGSAVTVVDFGEIPTRDTDFDGDYGTTQSIDVKASNLTGDVYLEIEDPSAGQYFSIYDPRYAVAYFKEYTLKPTNGAIDTSLVLDANAWSSTGLREGKLKVSSKASTADFTAFNVDLKVTVFDIEAGDYDINLNNTFFGLAGTGANPDEQTGSYKGITVVAGCESTATSKTYYDASHVRFYGGSFLKISAPAGFVVDTIRFTAGGTWNNNAITVNVGSYDDSKKEWSGSASCVTFNFSLQDRISKVMVSFKEAPTVGLPTIHGQTPFYPSTTVTMSIETEGADIIYTTNGEDPLGGDNTYTQPIIITETKTYKARGFKGVELGDVVTKTFTKATPISVADAIALIPDAGNIENDQFVVGYVCTASENEPSNGQMTYYISDNGSTVDEGTATTDRLQIYKGKGLNNADFTAASDLAVGDKVVIYGQLKNYNGTYEFNSGNYIVEYTKKELKAVGVSGSLSQTEYDYGDQLNVAGLKVTAYYTVGDNVDVTNDPSVVWTIEGSPLSEKLIYGGNSFVQASFGGKTSSTFNITTTIKTYALTFSAPSNGTLVIKDALGEEISSGDKFWKNEPLTVWATPATGYKLDKITVLKASDDSDITSEVLTNNRDLDMPNYAIKVSASFAKLSYGKLTLSKNVIDFGTVKVGESVGSQSFKLSGTGFTPGNKINLSFTDADNYGLVVDEYTADSEGNISEKNVEILVDADATKTYGSKDCSLKISGDDLAADSIVAIKMWVGGKLSTTPSPVALDLGDVLYKDELTQYAKPFRLHIENLTVGAYNQVKIDFGGADSYAYGTDGNIFITDNDQDGVIDQDVKIKPSNMVMTYSLDQIKGQHTATIRIMPTGATASLIETIEVGTVTMNIVAAYGITVADITGGSLTWNGGEAPQVAKENATFTLAAVPALGYKDGVIKVVKAEDETDITSTVLSNGVLTMPAYAIKVYVTFESGQQDPQLSWSGVDSNNRAWAYMTAKPNVFPTLNAPEGLEITYSCADGDGIITIDPTTGAITLLSENAVHITATSKATEVYSAGTATYTLYVCGLDYISLDGAVAKTEYEYGDAFDRTGLTVTAHFTNAGGTYDISDKATWSIDPETITQKGSVKVVVTYGNQSDDDWISVYLKTHAVSWTSPAHGTITVYDDTYNPFASGTKFRKGRTFTVTAEPATGYRLKTLTANGEDISSTKAFTMGTEDIEVVATFEEHKENPNFEWKIGDEVVTDVYVTFAAKDNVFPTLSNPHNLGKYFYSSNTAVASIGLSDGKIYLQGGGETTIKAWFWGTDEYEKDSAEFVLHVAKAQRNLQWSQTIPEDGWTARIYGGADARQLPYVYDAPNSVVVTSSNEEVVKIDETFKRPQLQWTVGDAIITATCEEDNQYLGAQISYTVHAIDDRLGVTLKWRIDGADVEEATVTIVGNDNIFPTLYNPRGITPTYTSSDETKATIDEDGTISLKAAGTTTITATYAGNNLYKPATASYTLTIKQYAAVITFTPDPLDLAFGEINRYADAEAYAKTVYISATGLSEYKQLAIVYPLGFSVDPDRITANANGEIINRAVKIMPVTDNPVGSYGGTTEMYNLYIKCTGAIEADEVVIGRPTLKIVAEGTGIDQVELEQQIRKEFRDGKLYILRGGKTYDAAGRLVK